MSAFNIYCDESCHLEGDRQPAMTLGAIWCPVDKSREIAVRLREIKEKHGMSADFEAKWVKVSKTKIQLYLDLVDYFFDDDQLHFRALIIPDKSKLCHDGFNGQTHDEWYYKMYFTMLKTLLDPQSQYRIYIDIKDTKGAEKIRKLHEILSASSYDFSRTIVERMQLVRSDEIQQMQLADLLIGAVSYLNRGLDASSAKVQLIKRIQERSKYALDRSTLLKEGKFNLFKWRAQEVTQ